MPTGAASRHAGFPSLVPNPLTGRGEGLPSRRGAPPSSLPTTSSSCTSPAGREGSQGSARCSGPQDLHPERAGCRQASPFPSCRWAPAQPGAHGPSRPTALFPMAYKGELSFHYFLFPFKRLKKKKNSQGGRTNRNAGNKHPPKLSTKPKAEGTVSTKPQRGRAPSHGHPRCRSPNPAPPGDGGGSPSPKLPPSKRDPVPPGRGHRQLLSARGFSLSSPAPSRRSGGGFGYRTPERRRPRPEPRTLCAETKTCPGPRLLLGAIRLARSGTPRSGSGAKTRVARSKPGGDGAAPRSGIHPPRGGTTQLTLLLSSTPLERGGDPLLPTFSPRRRGRPSRGARGWMRHAWLLAPAVTRRSFGG